MKRNEWIEQAKSKLDEWNEKVSELEARTEALEAEARASYHGTLAKARSHLGTAKAQVAQARDVGADAWADTAETLDKAWKHEKDVIENTLAELTA